MHSLLPATDRHSHWLRFIFMFRQLICVVLKGFDLFSGGGGRSSRSNTKPWLNALPLLVLNSVRTREGMVQCSGRRAATQGTVRQFRFWHRLPAKLGMVTWSLWLCVPQEGLASTAPPPKRDYSPLQQATAFPRASWKKKTRAPRA